MKGAVAENTDFVREFFHAILKGRTIVLPFNKKM
jgi:hypothetical protein